MRYKTKLASCSRIVSVWKGKVKTRHLKEFAAYGLGVLTLAAVLWALPSPASRLGDPDPQPARESAARLADPASPSPATSQGVPAPRAPRFTTSSSRSERRSRSDQDEETSRWGGEPPDRSRGRNLAQLSTGEWETREANSPAAGPSRPRQQTASRQSGSVPNRNFGERRGTPGSGGGVPGELEELERGYQTAQNMLYSGYGAGRANNNTSDNSNPFDEALTDTSGDSTSDPPASDQSGDSGGDTGDSTGGSEQGDGGDGGTGDSGGDTGDTNPEVPDNTHPDYGFDFLVVGAPRADGKILSKAHFTGQEFILDDDSHVSFFPGSLHALLSFGPDTMLLWEDTNRDGRTDFLRLREVPSVGTSIELFQQTAQGTFQLAASTVLYLERVHSAALFDIDGDSELELLLAKDGEKRLTIFEKVGKDWNYREELGLPVEPALMLVSNQVANGVGLGKLLHIIDSQLQLVLNARAASPIAFWFGLGTPLQRLRSVDVDFRHTGGTPDHIRVIEMADRLILFDKRDGEFVTFANLETGNRTPFLLIGDYSGGGQRETVWLP